MMTRTAPREHLVSVIEPLVTAAGLDLEDVVVTPAGRRSLVRVVVDGDNGVTLDDIAALSQTVSEALDTSGDGLGATPYILEISSPGVDRPLLTQRHWRRASGRLVQADLVDGDSAGQSLTGRVLRHDAAAVVLDVDGTEHELGYARIRKARVQVEFNRPKGGAPS